MKNDRVGIVGLGIMGSAMSANLMAAGFEVVGFDVLPRRRGEHRRAGGSVARSTRDLGRRAAIVVTSLPSADALADTARDLAAAGRRGQVVVETSTLPIAVKEAARDVLAARGITLVDCPLSGTGAQARRKDVIVFASGDRKACRAAAPVFDGFARAHHYVGPFGAGSKMKFVANLLVAVHNVAAAEAMTLGMKAGLDPAQILKVVSDGAGTSRMFEVRGPMMVAADYADATMKVAVWQKDMTVIGDFARKLGCPTPLFNASASIYTAAMAMGLEAEDTASVCAVLERMAGHDRKRRGRSRRSQRTTAGPT